MTEKINVIYLGRDFKHFKHFSAKYSNVTVFEAEKHLFGCGEFYINLPKSSLLNSRVILFCPLYPHQSECLLGLIMLIQHLQKCLVAKITICCPYLLYAKMDLILEESSSNILPIQLFISACSGLDSCDLITADLHSNYIADLFFNNFNTNKKDTLSKNEFDINQGDQTLYTEESKPKHKLLSINSVHLFSKCIEEILSKDAKNFIFVAPDLGSIERVKRFSERFNIPYITIIKDRFIFNKDSNLDIGRIAKKTAIIVDDVLGTGSTAMNSINLLKDKNINNLFLIVTHILYEEEGLDKIINSGFVKKIFTSNSILSNTKLRSNLNIEFVDILPLLFKKCLSF